MVERFIGCDWGTSSLRLRLVDVSTGDVGAEIRTDCGIKRALQRWQREGGDRLEVYARILQEHIDALARETASLPENLPVVLSGMSSSSIGMLELPYAPLPFSLCGEDAVFQPLFSPVLSRTILLVSGVRSRDDVMRGEETQLLGLWRLLPDPPGEAVVIMPGTHSKHVFVQQGAVRRFRTFMTGEMFDVLMEHTVLGQSVERGPLSGEACGSFQEGVLAATDRPLLNALFRVRTHSLFGDKDHASNFWFLSGLLIGSELSTLRDDAQFPLVLAADPALATPYQVALDVLDLPQRATVLVAEQLDRCAPLGQAAVLSAAISAGAL